MRKKMFWGVVTLIILLVGVISFVMLTRTTDTEPPGIVVNDVPEETLDNIRKENNRQILSTQKPPDEPGFIWEWHGDHWHKMPIAEVEKPVDVPKEQEIKRYTGPLTFHEELLKTNPVKALRLQAEERGHVNAKWIPPFPPDDTEAQELAKAEYMEIYNKYSDTPKFGIGGNSMSMMMEINKKYPHTSARNLDLSRLTWVDLDFSMGEYDLPSDYFPRKNPYADAFMKYGNSLIKQGHDTEAEQR